MPFYQFDVESGQDGTALDPEVIKSDSLRNAWIALPLRFTDDQLKDVVVFYSHEVEMPPGFEDEFPGGGETEGV